MDQPYPLTLSIDYPERPLDRLTSALRIFTIIPIAIVLATLSDAGVYAGNARYGFTGGGLLVAGPLLMILFRKRYPRWWFDFNLELLRFSTRVGAYLSLMDDRYPSTVERQSVHLDVPYPDVEHDLQRGMPLVKWLLAIPHYVVLLFLWIGAIVAVVCAWFAILFTGRYPRGLFDYVEGVIRWHSRVIAYALMLVTDVYPPFRLAA
jgi:uncharacterized protein DUF4389